MKPLTVALPDGLRWDDSVGRAFSENLPFRLPSGRFTRAAGDVVEIEVADSVAPRDAELAVLELLREIVASLRDARERVLREFSPPAVPAQPDPMIALRASGEVRVAGRGRLSYGGRVHRVVEALDRRMAALAAEYGAAPQTYPTTVSFAALARGGYLKAFPHQALFVASSAQNRDALAVIGGWATAQDTVAPQSVAALGAHDQVLSPTVCYHCFEALSDSRVARGSVFTAVACCHRFEVLAGTSLERLQTFRMREIIGFDSAAGVARLLDRTLAWTEALLSRWGIPHRVATATDPFFAGAAGTKAFFQAAFELKREMQVRLDFSGQWLAVASFNNHQQSMTKAFGITDEDERLESGCIGWGQERLAVALFARFGTDLSAWPAALRADLEV